MYTLSIEYIDTRDIAGAERDVIEKTTVYGLKDKEELIKCFDEVSSAPTDKWDTVEEMLKDHINDNFVQNMPEEELENMRKFNLKFYRDAEAIRAAIREADDETLREFRMFYLDDYLVTFKTEPGNKENEGE